MYKQKLILAVLALATLFVACNNDEAIEITETYPVEISISFPEKDQDFQYQGWNEKREIAALRTDTRTANKLHLTPSGGDTYQAVSESEINQYTEFAFIYPASVSTVSTSDTLTQTLYINSQEGTLDGLASYDYIWGTYTYNKEKENYAETSVLTSLMSFCKFHFTENGRPIEHISQVTITSPTDSIHVVGKLNLGKGSIASQNRGSMTIRNSQGLTNGVYAAFFPMETALHFIVSTLDGKSYEAFLPEMMSFKAGETFIFSDIECSELEPAHVGDYYYSDATWSTLLDESKKCVGIVYALEDKNGNIAKNISESTHGRVVALQDCVEKVTWCITGVDIEELENQTVLQDTMYVGSLPYLDGTANSFFSDKTPEQLTEIQINPSTGEISAWYSQGALADFDGEGNTQKTVGISGVYYAANYCMNYGRGLYGWYLPSAGELALLWAIHRTDIICNETHNVFKDLKEFGYWTSTEYDESNIWYVNFLSGMITKNSKASSYNVRPVIRF